MLFNREAGKKFDLEKYAYARLFFDPRSHRLGIALTNNKEEEGTRKLRKNKYGVTVGIKLVLDNYGIDIPKAVKCTPVWDKKENMIVVRLKSLGKKEKPEG